MNKRGQGLPMNTIIIIVLTLFVLAGVGIYFFGQFGTGTESTNSAQCIQLCESMKAQMEADSTLDWAGIASSQTRKNFCDGDCPTVVSCKLRTDAAMDTWGPIYLTNSEGSPYCKVG